MTYGRENPFGFSTGGSNPVQNTQGGTAITMREAKREIAAAVAHAQAMLAPQDHSGRDLRERIVTLLLRQEDAQGTSPRHITECADELVSYILNGKQGGRNDG